MATARPADYLPAVRFDFLTPVFDVFAKGTTRERTFKQRLLDQARLAAGLDVLDLGSGSGTLREIMDRFEKRILIQALAAHGNNKTSAAKTLGITREGLHKKLKGFGL